MSENQNPNTPKKRQNPVMTGDGCIAFIYENRDRYGSPSPGKKRPLTAIFGTPISNINPSDKNVKKSKKAQQNGPSPPSPQGVGIMPGNVMTPNANNLL
jgi:hypothetical protein